MTKYVHTDNPLHTQLEDLQAGIKAGCESSEPRLFVMPSRELGTIVFRENEYNLKDLSYSAVNALVRRWATPVRTNPQGAPVEDPQFSSTLISAYVDTGDWPGVPVLNRMASAPLVRPDLTVRWDKGYDRLSKSYVVDSMEPTSDFETTREGALSAAAYLLSWFAPFALQHEASKADCLGLALTPLLMSYTRQLSEANVPGGLFSANEKGSGKTELAKLIGILGTGVRWDVDTFPQSETEQRKKITTTLKAGEQVGIYDNSKAGLDSEALEALLTGRGMVDREMKTHNRLRLPNDTLWLFTANRPSMSPDMLRRLVLVPLQKRGWTGRWSPTVLADAQRDRRKIATAMATLIEHWAAQGAPRGSVSMSGYEVWSETVSGILEAAGVSGFNTVRDIVVGETVVTEEEDQAQMVLRIAKLMGTTETWKTADLYNKGNDPAISDLANLDVQAVRMWLNSGGGKNPVMSVGHKLKDLVNKDFPEVDYRIVKNSTGTAPGKYLVEYTGSGQDPLQALRNLEAGLRR